MRGGPSNVEDKKVGDISHDQEAIRVKFGEFQRIELSQCIESDQNTQYGRQCRHIFNRSQGPKFNKNIHPNTQWV